MTIINRGTKLGSEVRTVLARRAKQRRQALKMTCRDVGDIIGMSAASVAQWEKLLPKLTTYDLKWEAALKVPPGWLRNPELAAPVPVTPSFTFLDELDKTVAQFINAYCVWYIRPSQAERTISYPDLSPREQRLVDIVVRRYGFAGETQSTLQAIADDLGLTRERIRQIGKKAKAHFDQVNVPLHLINRLKSALAKQLPCRISELSGEVQQILGDTLSLEGADRFFREVLGESLVNFRTLGGTLPAEQEKIVVADDAPNEDLVRTVRQVSLGIIRQAGAAHVYFVAGTVGTLGLTTTPIEVIQCARMYAGFEWLVEDEGWFWYGPGTDNRAKWTALKVLSVANRPVDIEELYGAMARARFSKTGDRINPATVSAPLPVLQVLLNKIPEIQRSHLNDFKISPDIAASDPATFLSPAELTIYEAIKRHDGVVNRRTLIDELIETGKMEKVTMSKALMSSPVFRRHDRGIWTISGFSFSSEALQRAQAAKRQLKFSDGWYEMEVAFPRSAFERGDWFAPAAAQQYLSPGEYMIQGIDGITRYVENAVGDPYLKQLGYFVASAGFEMGLPYLFSISATERMLRFEHLHEDETDASQSLS
jgi:transcriptional regulator with XRE-family HTH domain